MLFECAPLADTHVIDCLDTGHGNAYGQWLSRNARRFHASGLCRVYILTENAGQVARGFFTLSSHVIMGTNLTRSQRGGVNPTHRIPAQLLGKFAVAADLQGSVASSVLMFEVFKAYARIASLTATRFLVLDVAVDKIAGFYQSFGFTPIPDSATNNTDTSQDSSAVSSQDAMTTMILPTSAILQALK